MCIRDSPKNILGGKGANLAEMGRLGFPVHLDLLFLQMHVKRFTKIIKN